MSANVSRCRWNLVTAGLALILPLSGFTQDNAPPEALNVKVFPDRYVAAGKPFSDLAALEAWAKPIRIRVLWLDSCGPASTKQLLAAVERFHFVYAEESRFARSRWASRDVFGKLRAQAGSTTA
jgi:hypothetical protein